jgi:P27 family predicted phage terminase small subunit
MPARRPALQLLREGNQGHHPRERLEGGLRLKPSPPQEPDWAEVFPSVRGDRGQQAVVARLRRTAREEWGLIVHQLDPQGLLAPVDATVLQDHCVAEAIRRECVRDIVIRGLTVQTAKGERRNPSLTTLAQQRERLKFTTVQLGASPLSRDSLNPRSADEDDEGIFD